MKLMWLSATLVHIYRAYTEPGEPPEDGDMNEMTLPSRHEIRALAV